MARIIHVTPITPNPVLESLAGRSMMVRWGRHDQVRHVERLAAEICYENGAFGFHKKGVVMTVGEWERFYAWLEDRLFWPGRWAICPDVIGEGSQVQDMLLAQWPFGHRGAPVWHTDEPIDRLLRLVDLWPRVCIGSTGEHWSIWLPGLTGRSLNPVWRARMDEVWQILGRRRHAPVLHMLRGTAVGHLYPFDSADSSSVGQNGHRHRKKPMGLFDDRCGAVDYADKLERQAAALP